MQFPNPPVPPSLANADGGNQMWCANDSFPQLDIATAPTDTGLNGILNY